MFGQEEAEEKKLLTIGGSVDTYFGTNLSTTDVGFISPNGTVAGAYAFGAQLAYKGQFLNFYYDDEAKLGLEIDYTGSFNLINNFYLGINAAYDKNNDSGFTGAVFYPQLATSDSFKIGIRGEYFSTFDGVDSSDDPSVFGATLTGSYTAEHLTIKPELRLDSAANEIFVGSDLAPSKNLSSFLIAVIYSF